MSSPPSLTQEKLPPSLQVRVYLIIGRYARIGYELAKMLLDREVTVCIAEHSKEKGYAAIEDNINMNNNPADWGELKFLHLDLAELEHHQGFGGRVSSP